MRSISRNKQLQRGYVVQLTLGWSVFMLLGSPRLAGAPSRTWRMTLQSEQEASDYLAILRIVNDRDPDTGELT